MLQLDLRKLKERKKMSKRYKITRTFLYSLAIISILGFLAIISNVWLKFNFLSLNMSSLILIILGIGLMVEGQIRRWKSMVKQGLTSSEFTHIVTGIVGVLAVVFGTVGLFGVTGATIEAGQAIVASIAVVIIVIETWLVT